MYIAKDAIDGDVKLFLHKPVRGKIMWLVDEKYKHNLENEVILIPREEWYPIFKDLTWEDEPQWIYLNNKLVI